MLPPRALMLSLIIHLLPLLFLGSMVPPTVGPHEVKLPPVLLTRLLQPPAASQTTPEAAPVRQPEHQYPDRPNKPASPITIDDPGEAPVIEVEASTFGGIFAAAAHWKAEFRAGVAFHDPERFDIAFCSPGAWPQLTGRYRPGDVVRFAFPLELETRIRHRAVEKAQRQGLQQPLRWIRIAFDANAQPDFFTITDIGVSETTTQPCS